MRARLGGKRSCAFLMYASALREIVAAVQHAALFSFHRFSMAFQMLIG